MPTQSIVLNIHAHDRPGIMSRLSQAISEHGGNWQESRMARLAGQFAGIVRVQLDSENWDQLQCSLESLSTEGIHVRVIDEGDLSDHPYTRCIRLEVTGNDRPGIVSQLTHAISSVGANIEELNTFIESAAMAGHPIFTAQGTVCLTNEIEDEVLISCVENLSDDLSVEIHSLT